MYLTKQDIAKALGTGLFALLLSYGIGISYAAWTSPTQVPPSGNAMAPLNVGDTIQYKGGNLVLNASTSQATVGLQVWGGLWVATTSSSFNQSLRLQVDGLIGATKFCDVGGLNCFTAASSSATIATVLSGGSGGGGGSPDSQIFTSPGTWTWTKPSGVTTTSRTVVEVWGGGGGGGGGGTPSYTNYAGGGGGGGAYSRREFKTSDLSGTITVTVGAGGSGGNSGTSYNGQTGGNSSFGTLLNGYAGAGGTSLGIYASSNPHTLSGWGGGGGGTTGAAGDRSGGGVAGCVWTGGPYGMNPIPDGSFGGGCSGNTTEYNGVPGNGSGSGYGGGGGGTWGNGGSSGYGGGGGGGRGSTSGGIAAVYGGNGGNGGNDTNGGDGIAPAGGGGGSYAVSSAKNGGNGARGEVRVITYK
jgi:hypothetical protein